MNRCLHITIHENAATLPRRGATADLDGRASSDPEANRLIAPVDDPGSSSVMGSVDNPEANRLIAPVDDPSGTRFPSGGPGVFATVAAATGSCCCPPACQDTAAPGKTTPCPFIGPQDSSAFVIVRMAEGVVSKESLAESLWALATERKPPLRGLTNVLKLAVQADKEGQKSWRLSPKPPASVIPSRPLVELQDERGRPLPRKDSLAALRDLEKSAATTAFPPLHSLANYWRLDLREHPELVDEVVERLNGLAEVDMAYRMLTATDPRVTAVASGQVFADDQGYLDDAPLGISASWAWKSLAAATSPATVTLCDLEQGWNPDHLDLKPDPKPRVQPDIVYGANRAPNEGSSGHHGTAVLGQLAAAGRSALGIKGAVSELGWFVLASHYRAKAGSHPLAGTTGHVAAAIAQVLRRPAPLLKAGDILLLEVQRGLLPAEVDAADFDAIRLATALDIIVIEAAGNGGFDLDAYADPATGRSLHRGDPRFRDSGAILVGAARAGLPHDRLPFSNYGSRLDCFGWGESVTTCGFGDLAGTGDTNYYTNHFSGTSSAVPIIAGAAALLQSLYEAHAGVRLGPQAMRAFLSDPATGTRQGPNVAGHIGVMPDLEAIGREQLQVVPDVYLRRSIGDDGSAAGPQDEISSSPDLLVGKDGIVETRNRFGEGTLRENLPAPGALYAAGSQDEIYVRLRNRGIGDGAVHVQLFASPAATLITSERWIPIGRLDVSQMPQGDTLEVAGPVVPAPPLACPPGTLWSFLAILSKPGEIAHLGPPFFDWAVGLPPGPPYFDWTEYRAFLRRPGVAWRNTHRVAATRSTTLTFRIAGTPDRDRHFDFEVIQRLPAGATVALTVGDALAAKLRQRQPWLGEDSGPQILLPKRPRTAIRGVHLAAGAYAEATFTVNAGNSVLTAGHSLALRQLWRGEEVGRITWFFGPHP